MKYILLALLLTLTACEPQPIRKPTMFYVINIESCYIGEYGHLKCVVSDGQSSKICEGPMSRSQWIDVSKCDKE